MPEEVGGIVGTISLEAEGLDVQLAKLKAAMDQVQRELEELHAGFDVAGKSAAVTGMQIGDGGQGTAPQGGDRADDRCSSRPR